MITGYFNDATQHQTKQNYMQYKIDTDNLPLIHSGIQKIYITLLPMTNDF